MKKNLVLTGMMGSGKSTVGKSLSEQFKGKFIDIDSIIENKMSMSIASIFEIKGEDFFRKLEVDETIAYLERDGLIMALGGGAFLNNRIREKVKKNSVSFWLHLDIEELHKRTKINKKRPLISAMSKEDLEKLYNDRKKIYSLADFKVDCNSKDKNKIVREIIEIYENS